MLVGEHDFRAFTPTETQHEVFVARVESANWYDRRASNGERSGRRQMRYRYERERAEKRALKSSAAASAAATATSSGNTAFSASTARSTGGPPLTSTETTFASACTPVSVRPATASWSTVA